MARILMVVAPTNFRDEEYFKPKQVLEGAGHIITTGSTIADEVRSAQGKTVEARVRLTTAETFDFDAIIFVGGPGMVELVGGPDMIALAKKFYRGGKLVAAICIAPAILANAGILKDKKATSAESAVKALRDGSADYTANEVETDGNIITANGPGASERFGLAILDFLKTHNVQPSA